MNEPGMLLQLPRPRSMPAEVFRDSLLFLLRQWQSDFVEAKHVLPFPAAQGFRGPEWLHDGDVFQRAIIGDALCDAALVAGDQLDGVVAAQIDYLMSQRRTSGVGGWSYFPRLIELPPDVDDLAQVMTLCLRGGRRDLVAAFCEEPLRVALADGALADGGFETWIVPKGLRTSDEWLQSQWIDKAWGRGADADVVANLMHGLLLYDRARFKVEIEVAAEFLVARQERDGSWKASWYWGPYYPTFVALRSLTLLGTNAASLEAAVGFLLQAQHEDGGWGAETSSDALSTALAVCALAAAGALDEHTHERALAFIAAARNGDGGWPAIPWIRMDLGRAAGMVHQTLSYGSRSITTAYVLKAALGTGGSTTLGS